MKKKTKPIYLTPEQREFLEDVLREYMGKRSVFEDNYLKKLNMAHDITEML